MLRTAAPTFAAFVVAAGTWRERDAADVDETENEDSETINLAIADPGVDCEGEWAVKTGQTPAKKGDLVTSTAPTTRRFVVMEVENFSFGGRVHKQRVQLMFRTKLDTVLST